MTGERGRCPVHGIALEPAAEYDAGAVCPRCVTDDAPELATDGGRPGPVGREVLDAVEEDDDLRPEEKETTLRFGKREDYATVYTAEAGIGRRLLAHPHTSIEGLTVLDEGVRRDVSIQDYTGGAIVGVRVRVPVGAVSIRSSPRSSTQHADIVTDRVFEEVRS